MRRLPTLRPSNVTMTIRGVRRLLLLCLLCLLCLSGWAACAFAANPDRAPQSTRQTPALDQVQVFEDASTSKRLDDVLALPTGGSRGWRLVERKGLKPGFSRSAWWLRAVASNRGSAEQSLVLVLREPRLQHVDFYIGTGSRWRHENVDSVMARTPRSRYPLVQFTLAPGERVSVLIRVASETTITLEPNLYSADEYDALEKRAALWDAGFIGGVLALAWCALLIAYFSRSGSFLVLAALCVSTALYEASARGYTTVYLWPHAADWSTRSPSVFGCTGVLLAIVFILRIADGENAHVPARRVLVGFAVLEGIAAVGAALGRLYVFSQLGVYGTALFSIVPVGIAAVLVRQSTPTARIILVTVCFALFNGTLRTLDTVGALPAALAWLTSDIRPNPIIAIIGLATHLIVLAAWINHVGKQRGEARAELSAWQESEHERLRYEVAQRTSALNEALLDAEEKNQQKIETLRYVSHDLRAPLATIASYAQLLLNAADSKQVALIHAIERSVNYQLGLIDELIGHAKAELEPLDIAPIATDLPALLHDLTEYASALCTQLNNRFHFQALTSLPRRLMVDGRRLQQILLNLLSNASKFTRDGVVMMTVRARRHGTQWLIGFEVVDTGIGMDVEHQANLFSGFRPMQSANGTNGLGLSIAQRIVNIMGGELRVSSAPNRGTSFSFEIVVPMTDAADASSSNLISYWSSGSAEIAQQQKHLLVACVPPEKDRRELAVLAKDGRLTDIERWIATINGDHPACAAFLTELQRHVEALDFTGIEALALAR